MLIPRDKQQQQLLSKDSRLYVGVDDKIFPLDHWDAYVTHLFDRDIWRHSLYECVLTDRVVSGRLLALPVTKASRCRRAVG